MEQRGRLRHRWANQPRWVAARERGRERVSNGREHMSQSAGAGKRPSFKRGCCNFCKRLFLKAAWRWVDRIRRSHAIEEESVNTLYAQSNQKTVP
jgi:hypothetical protein